MTQDRIIARSNDGARVGRAESDRILVVDDDPMLLGVLAETLWVRLGRVTIDTSPSGAAALARLGDAEYDVLVSDCLMPGMNGVSLLERARVVQPDVIVILVTGVDDRDLTLRALRAGAYDFIQKPVDPDYLAASVRRALETRRLRREVELQQLALKRHADSLEATVEQRTRELRDAHRVKDEFLATVSHELRTPLTAILGWARLLCGGALDDAMRLQAVESIARNARSQAQLIDDLLDISRIITGKLRLEVQEVDLGAVLDAALGAVLPAAQAKRIRVEKDVEQGLEPVAGDPERLQQVLWNLLSNAIKFTREGGNVRIRIGAVETSAVISVVDDGCGIPQDFLPFVFDRLRQGAVGGTSSRRGLGLGLAIVRHLVELHGGTVLAHSDGPGTGARFEVRLSRHRPDGVGRSPRPWFKTGDLGVPVSQCLRGVRVLVVDDEADARDVLGFVLQQAGAVVEAAATSREGYDAFDREPPDVLLCDIGLPDEDGYALLRRVRARPPRAGGDVAAVALTAHAQAEDGVRALEAGFSMHLPKPGPADLASILAQLLDAHRRRRSS